MLPHLFTVLDRLRTYSVLISYMQLDLGARCAEQPSQKDIGTSYLSSPVVFTN